MGGSHKRLTTGDSAGPWIKSSFSGPTGGNCVEVAFRADGEVAVRNSRHPHGAALIFTGAEWDAFLSGARSGEFDRATGAGRSRQP